MRRIRKMGAERKRSVLARMIELLDRPGGWAKGSLHRSTSNGDSYCLLGAAGQAYKDVYGRDLGDDYDLLGSVCEDLSVVALIRAKGAPYYADPSSQVFRYNDAIGGQKGQARVVKLLKEKQAELATS